ncbi:MAG: DUF4363 family protein [Clostridia bacterium]|nr:DUF4363 family protein [Clostridia bacterium]
MARKIIIMAAVLSLLLLLSVLEQISVSRITQEALHKTEEIMHRIRAEQFETAHKMTKTFDQEWDRQAKMLEMMVDHGSTDDVRYAFSRLLAALEARDSATAMVYVSELEGAIEHVYERQAVTIENIL